jgi:hypothetical protein
VLFEDLARVTGLEPAISLTRRFNTCNMFAMILEQSIFARKQCIMARLASWILVRI